MQAIFHYLIHNLLILGMNITLNEVSGCRDITNLYKKPTNQKETPNQTNQTNKPTPPQNLKPTFN